MVSDPRQPSAKTVAFARSSMPLSKESLGVRVRVRVRVRVSNPRSKESLGVSRYVVSSE